MPNKFIKIKDVALILGVSKATLRNWDSSGKLKAHRHPFNNYRVYKIEEVDKVIEILNNSNITSPKKKEEVKKMLVRHLD